jgi:hypothetical protein
MIVENLTKTDVGITKDKYDFSNFFKVAYDSELDEAFYSINKTIYFKTPPSGVPLDSVYTYYTILYGDTWPLISYKHYKTVKLWWMVCKFNNMRNPLAFPAIDTKIKILNQDIVEDILRKRF